MLLNMAPYTATRELAKLAGVSADVFITAAAKALGIPKCSKCQERSKILRRIDEIGVWTALNLIKETLKDGSYNSNSPGH